METTLRQQSIGPPAARSTLLTLLGEYIAPRNRSFYRDGLIGALEQLGYGTHAARQALARSISGGWLTSERVGRRSLMRLTESTRAVLRAGYPRIYRFGEPWHWDGRWLLVVVRVPEERREIRDRLRTQLSWAGFGSLGGGLWISPSVERERELDALLSEEAGENGARRGVDGADLLTLTAELGSFGLPEDVIEQAWDLDEIAAHYTHFIDDVEPQDPIEPREVFQAQVALVHAWRKFPFIDPDLPDELLPSDWPRERAHALFHERHDRWAATAEDYFRSLLD